MKQFIIAMLGMCTVSLSVSSFTGCGKGTNTTAAAQYNCPMHPEIVTNTPGKCPKCQMDLKPKT